MIKDRKAFIQLTTVSISGSSTEPDVSPKKEKETKQKALEAVLSNLNFFFLFSGLAVTMNLYLMIAF